MRHKAMQAAGIVERFFHTGELRINYVVGPANGPPIVFIPAQGMTWEEYVLLLPMLAPDFQVFAVSVPGHGKSSWTPGKYTFDQLGVAMSAFLHEVVGGPAIVGGNSSGGVLTMWLAANAPELVTASIIEDAPFFRADKVFTVIFSGFPASKIGGEDERKVVNFQSPPDPASTWLPAAKSAGSTCSGGAGTFRSWITSTVAASP